MTVTRHGQRRTPPDTKVPMRPEGSAAASGHRPWRFGLAALLLLAMVGATLGAVVYRRQIGSYLTHRKGSPTHTEAYRPFPADDLPELRIAVAGDVGDSGRRLDATGAAMARAGGRRPVRRAAAARRQRLPVRRSGRAARHRLRAVRRRARRAAPSCSPSSATTTSPTATPSSPPSACRDAGGRCERGDVLHRRARLEPVGRPGPAGRGSSRRSRRSTATWKIVALHHPPYSGGLPGLEPRRPRRLRPALRALRRAARALRPRPRLPAQQGDQRRDLRRHRRRRRHPPHRRGRASPPCRSRGTATSSSASTPTASSVGSSTRTTESPTSGRCTLDRVGPPPAGRRQRVSSCGPQPLEGGASASNSVAM